MERRAGKSGIAARPEAESRREGHYRRNPDEKGDLEAIIPKASGIIWINLSWRERKAEFHDEIIPVKVIPGKLQQKLPGKKWNIDQNDNCQEKTAAKNLVLNTKTISSYG